MWDAHEGVAGKAGISDDAIDAIKSNGRPQFTNADERAVYEFSSDLLETRSVTDARHTQALSALGVTGLVELTALLGYYVMVAMMLNAHDLH
jgi:4-carboxymuconolactone decarboxylase